MSELTDVARQFLKQWAFEGDRLAITDAGIDQALALVEALTDAVEALEALAEDLSEEY